MLEIGMICAEAGEKKTGWLEIEGGGQKLPLTLICGAKEGPTMMISAGVHGAEYIGVQALSELSRELDPKDIAGNVICLHVANPSAFRDYVRFFVPEDGKNLNRVFPGKKEGTLSERIAWTITEKLQSKADYYIDLHAGDTSEEVMPFVYYNVAAGEKIARVSANMAMAADMEVRASSTATFRTVGSRLSTVPSFAISRSPVKKNWFTVSSDAPSISAWYAYAAIPFNPNRIRDFRERISGSISHSRPRL